MKDYQVMPPLTAEEYEALKADIEARGVQVPIEFDTDGNCIDGHHRLQICEELGITDYPTVTRTYDSETAKFTQARVLNMTRRQTFPPVHARCFLQLGKFLSCKPNRPCNRVVISSRDIGDVPVR